ncbi:peptidoglycan DD-metalloendopeptidase family protein [Bradyrhizobium erythrophlei]|uniref:peptidoglycan DD-metalloendopeptidase family protein n=1 Tax=Bradyrhizobium erythrophlei TaxID=1437360 RepID=UPI0015618DE3|nr:peptidoglycan DD-metalloendopeptidase family protein [Bradyrhizobium erythrophlei]
MLLAIWILAATTAPAPAAESEAPLRLGLPVNCRLGEDCFVQQMPDIDPSEQALDPLCGRATYQGHDGWDIRVRSLKDVDRPSPVIAIAEGTVARTRDGVPDRIYDRVQDGDLKGKECGNGVVVEHAGGLVSQYCHLKEGSIAVRPGTRVGKGDSLGSIGASGLAEFPHVHLSVRRDGQRLEPLTGRLLDAAGEQCGDTTRSLFEPSVRDALTRSTSAILLIGLTNAPPESSSLVRSGDPPVPTISEPVIAWVWAINVEPESLFRMRLVDPDRKTILNFETKSLEGRKATYVAYVGGKHALREGSYRLQVDLVSDGQNVRSTVRSIFIGP